MPQRLVLPVMLALALILQMSAQSADSSADSPYSTSALRDFMSGAAAENRTAPVDLAGYHAAVESELAFVLRDSLGRELVGQVEQLAANAEWTRDGRYDLHVVGYRSQSMGTPYSALTFTRMWTVPTLYGNRLFLGINDGIPYTRGDSARLRKQRQRDSTAQRDRYRLIHPLADDRDRFYRFSGGDTVATIYSFGRAIRIVRVHVEPVMRPNTNFEAFKGELDFDAKRHQLVRMRGRLMHLTGERDPLFARSMGAVAVAYMEFENAEIDGRYWLPVYQRSEFQAQLGMLGDTRPIYRLISRFRQHTVQTDSSVAGIRDTVLPRTRARLTFASRDSVSRFGEWRDNLGTATGALGSDDFDDIAPDVWKSTGRPRTDLWPRRMEDVVRYNRVEGLFTGAAGSIRFRDMAPGVSARGALGWAWTEQTLRGGASVTLARNHWIQSVRGERTLGTTNDFLLPFETGQSIGPLFIGTDYYDYVDRRLATYSVTRILGDIDRALVTVDAGFVEDRPEMSRMESIILHRTLLRANRDVSPGRYGRSAITLEFHPRVTGETLAPGVGVRVIYEVARGQLDWQRAEARIATRRYWHGLSVASRLDGGVVLGAFPPPQAMFELGGDETLPSYEYKEFGGDRAVIGRGLIAYYLPVLRTPRRLFGRIVVPGLGPGIGTGIHGGWTEVSSAGARRALLALGGDGITPLSRPTDGIRATADIRLTILSGALGGGIARAIDQPDEWKPFFGFGLSF